MDNLVYAVRAFFVIPRQAHQISRIWPRAQTFSSFDDSKLSDIFPI